MKNKTLISVVILVTIIAGGYLYLKNRPHNREILQQDRDSGHPPIQAPRFKLQNISGENIDLADFHGKAIVINFFATWCPPCRTEIPVFVKIYNQYREKGLEIIGISLDNDPEKVLPEFITDHQITYSVAIGTKEVITNYGGIQSIPTTFFINRAGEITNVHMGFIDESTFEKETQKILSKEQTI